MIWVYLLLAIIVVMAVTFSYKSMIAVVLVPIVWFAIWLGSRTSKPQSKTVEPKKEEPEPFIISWIKKIDEELEKASKKK